MKQSFARALMMALLLSACSQNVDQRRQRAEQLLGEGAYSEALIELRNAEKEAPDDAHLKLLLAQAQLRIGEIEGAAQALDAAQKAGAEPAEVARLRADLLLARSDHAGLLELANGNEAPLEASTRLELQAQALVGLDRCTEAIPVARAALQAAPVSTAARLSLASCYAGNDLHERALRELESSQDPAVLLVRGRLERAAGKPMQAAATWAEAAKQSGGTLNIGQRLLLLTSLADLEIERNDLDALRQTHKRMLAVAPEAQLTTLLAARIELMQGKLDTAVNSLRALAAAAPDLAVVRSTLTSAYIRQRNWEQARREAAWLDSRGGERKTPEIEKQVGVVSQLPADSEQYWLLAAGLHLALGQMDAVHEALAKAQAAAPQSFAPELARARLQLQIGNVEHALELTTRLNAAHPDDAAIQLLHADALLAANRTADAAAVFAALYSRQPSAALAVALHRVRERGAMPDAIAPLEQWLERNPRDLPIRAALAEALRKAGDNARAQREYEAIVTAAPRSVPALNNLAWVYHLAGDKRALETARRAWDLAPKSPDVQDTYGWLLVESGSVDEGAGLLQQADARVGLTQPEVRVHYVTALRRQGKADEALARLRELQAEKPEFPAGSEAARLFAALGAADAT